MIEVEDAVEYEVVLVYRTRSYFAEAGIGLVLFRSLGIYVFR